MAGNKIAMQWDVKFTSRAKKGTRDLPARIQERLYALALEIRITGPERHTWANYSKIKGEKDCYHCHLKKGKPTYVAVWKVTDREKRFVEIRYAGTHENADYKRLC